MKWKYPLLLVALLVVAGIVCAAELLFFHRVVVRNSSGGPVADVRLVVETFDGKWSLSKNIRSLKPGQSITVRHRKNDTKAVLRYVIEGSLRKHEEIYIDFWMGEGWMFDIQPDGTVKSGYDRSARTEASPPPRPAGGEVRQ